MTQLAVIAPMTRKDASDVWEIEKLSFSFPWSLDSFILEIEQNQCARYYTAKIGGKAVGYGGMWLILDEAHITNIAVHPDYRRQGIGRLLMQTLIREAAALGIERMTLEVRVSNHEAIRLYKRMGFEEGGIRKKYYPDNQEDALIMWNFHIGRTVADA